MEKDDRQLKCEDCGTAEDVEITTCPFSADVHGEEIRAVLCEECKHQRAMDI